MDALRLETPTAPLERSGERGIRTPETTFAVYAISNRAPSSARPSLLVVERRGRDSNPRNVPQTFTRLAVGRLRPLGHPSVVSQRRGRDSNPRLVSANTRFRNARLRPLGHLSIFGCRKTRAERGGFEPPVGFRQLAFSRRALSSAQPSLRGGVAEHEKGRHIGAPVTRTAKLQLSVSRACSATRYWTSFVRCD